MICAISGETPQEPVVSSRSGHVFEKRLIEKYIEEHSTCPITNQALTKDDLISVKAPTVKPRHPAATSIPSVLAFLQSEWDGLMIETHSLKTQYQQLRQELAHALYQYDAACRVIGRLVQERDQARDALTSLQNDMKE